MLVLGRTSAARQGWCHGIVRTDEGVVIGCPGLSLDDFSATRVGRSADVDASRGNHVRATILRLGVCGHDCWAQWEFENGTLHALLMGVTDETAERLGFATGYASAPEGPEVAFLRQWVRREVGRRPPVCLKWGEIGPVYDQVGGFARIRLTYHTVAGKS
jgi:hypothetical protein